MKILVKGETNPGNKLTTSGICLAHDLLCDISLITTPTSVTREVQILVSFLFILQRTTSHRQLIPGENILPLFSPHKKKRLITG